MIHNFFSEYVPKSIDSFIKKESTLSEAVTRLSKDKNIVLSDYDIAILGVAEYRNSGYNTTDEGVKAIRKELYQLNYIHKDLKLLDLGDFIPGKILNDSYAGLQQVIEILISNEVIPVVIGGSQDLSLPIFKAINQSEKDLNFVTVDSKIDYKQLQNELIDNNSYLNEILPGNNLLQYTNIATQKYLNDIEVLDFLKKNHYENYRLGRIRNKIKEIEPILRDSHFLSFDITSVKHSELPGQFDASPNGLNNDEICQIARYAGLGSEMKALGIFNYFIENDQNSVSSKALAQFIWHFIEGFLDRNRILSKSDVENVKKYIITIENPDHNIEFYNNPNTGHWWFLVPTKKGDGKEKRIACSANDYKIALNNQLPDRWWLMFQKLNF